MFFANRIKIHWQPNEYKSNQNKGQLNENELNNKTWTFKNFGFLPIYTLVSDTQKQRFSSWCYWKYMCQLAKQVSRNCIVANTNILIASPPKVVVQQTSLLRNPLSSKVWKTRSLLLLLFPFLQVKILCQRNNNHRYQRTWYAGLKCNNWKSECPFALTWFMSLALWRTLDVALALVDGKGFRECAIRSAPRACCLVLDQDADDVGNNGT